MDIEIISSLREDIRSVSLEQNKNVEKKREFYVKKENQFIKSETDYVAPTYNKSGKISTTQTSQNSRLITSREAIVREIWQQTYQILRQISIALESASEVDKGLDEILKDPKNENDPFGLASYFINNPEDWQKVQSGNVPDYFNVENTGNRILDIWLPKNEVNEVDIEFVKSSINRAYSEVAGMFGGKLPQLVLDTQEYVLQKFDEYSQNNALTGAPVDILT